MRLPEPWHLSYWSSTWKEMDKKSRRKFGWLILFHFILSLLFVSTQWVLYDEPDYFSYVVNWAKGHPERMYPIMDSKTPAVAVSLVPAFFKPFLPREYLINNTFFYLFAGRPFMYVYQLLGMFTFSCWVYRKLGHTSWFIPLLFFCFDPLVFSYGMFIGSDLASASLLMATLYAAWRFTKTNQVRYWVIMSTAVALAVVTKASMLFLYPLLFILFLVSFRSFKLLSIPRIIIGAFFFAIIQLVVINLAYYATGSFIAFGDYHFISGKFSNLQANLGWLWNVKMPLPTPFIQGIDMLQQHAEWGGCLEKSTYNGILLFDKVICKGTVWYYYLVVAFYKFPLLVWLLIIIAIITAAASGFKNAWKINELFIWLPLLYFLLILSFANSFQIGIRHAIILLPFLYLAIAPSINLFYERRKKLFAILVVLHLTSVIRYIPNLLSYTNEFLVNKTLAFHIIRDSSLDYGQSFSWVKKFTNEHPMYKQPNNLPDTGYFIVTVGHLFSEREGEAKNIAWLRNNFSPVDHYRYNILLFHITEKDLKEKGLKK